MRKSLRDAIVREADAARTIMDTAVKAERELTDVERDTINTHLGKAATLEASGKSEDEQMARMKALTEGLGIGGQDDEPEKVAALRGAKAVSPELAAKQLTIGEQFVKSGEWSALSKSFPGGQASENMRIQSGLFQTKSLLTGANHASSAGALLTPDYRGLLDPFYKRPLTIRDVVASGSTQTDTIEYVKLVSVTNNAAPVAEATSTAPVGGAVTPVMAGVKPESGMTFAKESTQVKTIAHWIPATKRALADASQIRTLIDEFLRYGLEEELEDQMLEGDGTGENLLGLANVSGVQIQAAPGFGGEDVFDVTRKARTKVRIGGRATPTAYVMNPLDWEKVELTRDANEQFFAGGPFSMRTPGLWGLPVVESEAIPEGTAWVGAWNWAVLYDRESASIQVTDAHNDFFTRNLVVILAEMRAAFAVLRPSAFVKIALV